MFHIVKSDVKQKSSVSKKMSLKYTIHVDGHVLHIYKTFSLQVINSEGRLRLLFCVNKTDSHNMKPLCIGKSHEPRCFHHVNMKSLPFVYANSSAHFTVSVRH